MTTTNGKAAAKKDPIPVRFDGTEDEFLSDIKKQTGLSKSEIVRRACCFAFPKFKSGEVDLLRLKEASADAGIPIET